MLLRESGRHTNNDFNLNHVTAAEGDAGVAHGALLRELTEATISGDWLHLGEIRAEAELKMGKQQVVDALTVAAAFNGITRVADATGIPLDDNTAQVTDSMRAETGIANFDYSVKSERYDLRS